MGARMNIVIAGICIVVGGYFILSFLTSTGIFEKRGGVYLSEIDMSIEEISRWADVIVIGTVGDRVGVQSNDDGKIYRVVGEYSLSIDDELTGNYSDKVITIKTLGDGEKFINYNVSIRKGERVLLFLKYVTTDSAWKGEEGYLLAGTQQKFSIDEDNMAYNPKYGSYKLNELVGIIKNARTA
ncbi:MAG: hypothetical protein NZ888_02430 [Candidatus Nitrosocaldus sp.]|nr:hypothetical protein [Candidatus Nitrosocaldus sp.]MDW7999897.1 hypothetical protein [Candidatus Nitrosocaldus sp.]